MRIPMFLALLFGVTPAMAQAPTIYITRHYDVPVRERDPDLLPQGQVRAHALDQHLKGKPLCAILVTDTKRARQTVAPLVKRTGLTPLTYNPFNEAALKDQVTALNCPTLIVGHSNTVPGLVTLFGGSPPNELAHSEFGGLWTLAKGKTHRRTITPR